IDACFSGSVDIPNLEAEDARVAMKSTEKIWTTMPETDRMCLLLSSQSFDESIAGSEDQNSVYTKYLIEGLRGVDRIIGDQYNPGSIDENGNVTPRSLHEFIRYNLSETDQHPSLKCNKSTEIILASYPDRQRKLLDNDTLFNLLKENNIREYNNRVGGSPYQSIDFHGRNLSGTKLDGGQFAMVNFNGCNLKGVSFPHYEEETEIEIGMEKLLQTGIDEIGWILSDKICWNSFGKNRWESRHDHDR
ncbi:MAG: hypothetical protein WAM14_06340, partial [Candidatus Nitrosopolaris sp.]